MDIAVYTFIYICKHNLVYLKGVVWWWLGMKKRTTSKPTFRLQKIFIQVLRLDSH